jgi:hypothetical protein
VAAPSVSSLTRKFDRPYPEKLVGYALFQFALLVVLTIGLGFIGESIGLSAKLAGVALIFWGLLNIGGLFDGRTWSFVSEAARVVAAPLVPLVLLSGSLGWMMAGLLALGTVAFAFRLFGLRDFFAGGTTAAMNAESI